MASTRDQLRRAMAPRVSVKGFSPSTAWSLEEYNGLANIPLPFLFSDIMKWEAGVPGTGRTCSWCCLVEFLAKKSDFASVDSCYFLDSGFIVGKKDTPWEGGTYKVCMEFSTDYPSKPPKCKSIPGIFNLNLAHWNTCILSSFPI